MLNIETKKTVIYEIVIKTIYYIDVNEKKGNHTLNLSIYVDARGALELRNLSEGPQN